MSEINSNNISSDIAAPMSIGNDAIAGGGTHKPQLQNSISGKSVDALTGAFNQNGPRSDDVKGLLQQIRALGVNEGGLPASNGATSVENAALVFSSLLSENNRSSIEGMQNTLDVASKKITEANKGIIKNMEANIQKIKQQANASFFQKLVSWIATAIAMVVGAAVAIATGGAALGPMIGAGITLLVNVMTETGAFDKIGAKIAEMTGNKDSKDTWSAVLNILSSIVAIIATCGASASGGLANAARSIQTVTKVVNAATATGSTAASAAGGATQAVLGYQIESNRADAAEKKSEATRQEAVRDAISEFIKSISKSLPSAMSSIKSVINSSANAQQSIIAGIKG